MTENIIQINAESLDTEEIVRKIRQRVKEKREDGVYSDPALARAERYNLSNLKDEEEFLPYYLSCLNDTTEVDINDFQILERRRVFSGVLVLGKKLAWKALKFYTYRLWSQQNQINGLLLGAIQGIHEHYENRIRNLEKRISRLENKAEP